MPYGAQTKVPLSRTKTDIKELLTKHGATGFAYATEGVRSLVAFSMSGRRVQIMLVMPSIDDYARTPRNSETTAAGQRTAWEQACRHRWCPLVLTIRAKPEAVASGITMLESEFPADIVLPEGGMVGEWLAPDIWQASGTGSLPPMLRARGGPER